jgi:nucleoside-diphosphate-sugar epimerase
MTKVLVVGGAGYVGGGVVDRLMASNHDVRVYDALLYEEAYRKPVDFVFGDIRDTDRLRPHLQWADAVVWLAALVGDGACALNPEVTVQINQEPAGWLAQNFDGRIIFTSTCSVYGAQPGTTLDESSPINPLSVYAVTKLAAEKYLEGKNAIIFRLGTLFGVGDLFARIRLDLVVNTMTARAHRQGHVSVYGGQQFRPLLHVADVAQAIVENLESSAVGVFNLNRQNVRIIDLAYQIRNHYPDLKIETKDEALRDARDYRVDSEKAHVELGFKPECSIDQGIQEVKELLDDQRIRDLESPRYTNQTFLSMFTTHLFYEGQDGK